MAIGEKIAEETSRTVSRRVLSSDIGPKMEISAESTGRILGVEYKGYVTYTAVVRPDGILQGQGTGVLMTKDGESITSTGHGLGRFTNTGGVSWRGMFFFQTPSTKLAKLNTVPLAFDYEVDAQGEGKGSFTEWR